MYETPPELLAKSKPLHELVRQLNFRVESVQGDTRHSAYVSDLFLVGGRIAPREGGYRPSLTLTVRPENDDNPVKKILYAGSSAVRGGDLIVASLPIFTQHTFGHDNWNAGGCDDRRYVYENRNLTPEEKAIEIFIVTNFNLYARSKHFLRSDRSIDYRLFLPPEPSRPDSGY